MQYLGLFSLLVMFPYFTYASLCFDTTITVSYTSQIFKVTAKEFIFYWFCIFLILFFVFRFFKKYRKNYKKLGLWIIVYALIYVAICQLVFLSQQGIDLMDYCPRNYIGDSTHAIGLYYFFDAFNYEFVHLFLRYSAVQPTAFIIGIVFFTLGLIRERKTTN